MDSVKVARVHDWPVPHNVTEVRFFLGFINFYRCFVEDFSHIAKPLNQLTKQDTQWSWKSDGPEQAAFDKLKHFCCYIFIFLFDIKILNVAPCVLRRGMYACVRRWAIYVRPRGV